MGLMKELALLPVAPLRFTVWVADKVAEEADRQQYSEGAGVQKLQQIEKARQKGEVDEEEAEELEGRVIEQQLTRARETTEQKEGAEGG
jgi:Gas vesicle protein G